MGGGVEGSALHRPVEAFALVALTGADSVPVLVRDFLEKAILCNLYKVSQGLISHRHHFFLFFHDFNCWFGPVPKKSRDESSQSVGSMRARWGDSYLQRPFACSPKVSKWPRESSRHPMTLS